MRDSRRLTGPNILGERPGPVIDIAIQDQQAEIALAAWKSAAESLLEAVGWGSESTVARRFPGGLSLGFSAPMDALYAACEMNEWAWSVAEAQLDGNTLPSLEAATAHFQTEIRAESNPLLLRLQVAAQKHGALFLCCDDFVSIGAGRHAETWPVKSLPEAGEIDWDQRERIPIAMITGTNGKTTTVRLLRSMVKAQGKVAGMSSTDWLMVGDEIIDKGDWAGPGGARTILRDNRVDVALLETARGGMLRRGLGIGAGEADVVLLTNIAEDHLGEWGIQDLAMLADTKFVIRHAGRCIVLNADNQQSVERQHLVHTPITWFSLDAQNLVVKEHLAQGGCAALLDTNSLWWCENHERQRLLAVDEIPITLNGAARHNTANALAAIAVAKGLGLDHESILNGLRSFRSDATDNPGRLNIFDINGVKILVDFAHNPHGLDALMTMAKAMQPKRLLVTLGHAGDRQDDALCEVALTAWRHRPDRVILKEQERDLRGRSLGEVPQIMKSALLAAGAPESAIDYAAYEIEAAKQALAWAKPGDLLLLLTLSHREEVLRLLTKLST